jgi:hypothetical protein
MKDKQVTATTVKIEKSLYDEFKILGIRHGLKLQGFTEKCVHLYVNDISFRDIVNSFHIPLLSSTGSFSTGSI